MQITDDTPRRMVTIRDATVYCGLCRDTIYKLGAVHSGLLRKYGKRTLVELRILDKILDALPVAEIKVRLGDQLGDNKR